ncbi:unnamed protein product [Cochlearia groenlandica]
MAPREPRRIVTQVGDQFGPYQSTLSTEKSLEMLSRTCAIPKAVELALPREGESPERVPAKSSPPTYRTKKEREARLAALAKVKKEEVSAFKASGEKPKVSLVADWVLQRAPDELRAVVAPPCADGDGEEEEEGLERRKRKRGIEDAGTSPRADLRTRSKSADQSATTFNRLLCGYEGMLTEPGSPQHDMTRTNEKLALTERSLETMRIASEKNVDRLWQVEDYRRQRDEARTVVVALETRVALMIKRAEIAEEKSSRFERELVAVEESSRAMSVKYETLLRLRDRDLRVSSHEARRGVKGVRVSVVNQAIEGFS